MATLADRIKEARKGAKLSQAQLATKVGITQGMISRLEKGTDRETVHLIKIARATGYSPDWLDAERGPKKMGVMEAVIRNLDDADQRATMAFIETLTRQKQQ